MKTLHFAEHQGRPLKYRTTVWPIETVETCCPHADYRLLRCDALWYGTNLPINEGGRGGN